LRKDGGIKDSGGADEEIESEQSDDVGALTIF